MEEKKELTPEEKKVQDYLDELKKVSDKHGLYLVLNPATMLIKTLAELNEKPKQ